MKLELGNYRKKARGQDLNPAPGFWGVMNKTTGAVRIAETVGCPNQSITYREARNGSLADFL
jgi:hypothetical protein